MFRMQHLCVTLRFQELRSKASKIHRMGSVEERAQNVNSVLDRVSHHVIEKAFLNPLSDLDFDELQLLLLGHPLLPYVVRAINDVNSELSDYVPPSSVWEGKETHPEVTAFLLKYLDLISLQNAAAADLQRQAIEFCKSAIEKGHESSRYTTGTVEPPLESPENRKKRKGSFISAEPKYISRMSPKAHETMCNPVSHSYNMPSQGIPIHSVPRRPSTHMKPYHPMETPFQHQGHASMQMSQYPGHYFHPQTIPRYSYGASPMNPYMFGGHPSSMQGNQSIPQFQGMPPNFPVRSPQQLFQTDPRVMQGQYGNYPMYRDPRIPYATPAVPSMQDQDISELRPVYSQSSDVQALMRMAQLSSNPQTSVSHDIQETAEVSADPSKEEPSSA